MTRVKRQSRSLILGAAFMGVMAGTGGFFGAVGAVMLVLLSRNVLGIESELSIFLSIGTAMGAALALFGTFALLAKQAPRLAIQHTPASSPRQERGTAHSETGATAHI